MEQTIEYHDISITVIDNTLYPMDLAYLSDGMSNLFLVIGNQ